MRFAIAFIIAAVASSLAHAKDVQTAILAGGCFWCVESDLESLDGVLEVVSGFSGGTEQNANYKKITSGKTKHREVVEVTFDADIISYSSLLSSFFKGIDPFDTTGSFCDRGLSYSAAVYATPSQKVDAKKVISDLESLLGQKIKTPILSAKPFYPAEDFHQNYYKSKKKVLTRFGRVTKAKAYKRYRKACGRDARVKEIWGSHAAFVN